jgi:hypothetical protein
MVTLAGRKYKRQEAISFLRKNPEYVKTRLGNLSKGASKLLKEAGYTITRGGPAGSGDARFHLLLDGESIWAGKYIPPPITKRVSEMTDAHDRGSQNNKGMADKGKPKPNPVRSNQGQPNQADAISDVIIGASQAGMVPTQIAGLAGSMGIDPKLLKGLNPNVGSTIPLGLAKRGAQAMGPGQIDALVASMMGGYTTKQQLMQQQQADMGKQNAHNLEQIRHWYDQVVQSQGVAAQRDREFGQAAVQSVQDATQSIVSALGGEANEGSYVAGAAGAENVGNLQAIATIQDQYNADLAPLLQGEAAGQLVREQAAGGQRLKDLRQQLIEMQAQRNTDEANLRFNVWQSNNEILDRRIQTELAIRQANQGLQQQRFSNKAGLAQMQIAAMAGAQDSALAAGKMAQDQANRNADRLLKGVIAAATERGRNYRATLKQKGKTNTFAKASSATRDQAYYDIVDAIDVEGMDAQSAARVAVAVAKGYGWSPQNPAVANLIQLALREAGFE